MWCGVCLCVCVWCMCVCVCVVCVCVCGECVCVCVRVGTPAVLRKHCACLSCAAVQTHQFL